MDHACCIRHAKPVNLDLKFIYIQFKISSEVRFLKGDVEASSLFRYAGIEIFALLVVRPIMVGILRNGGG